MNLQESTMLIRLIAVWIWLAATSLGVMVEAVAAEINTVLMESTFRIEGPQSGQTNGTTFGTTFLMGKKVSDKPVQAYYVLVTAAHVFDSIDGDIATILLRQKNTDGSYSPRPWDIRLRDGGMPLYVKHAEADAAALYVRMPDDLNVEILPIEWFADDNTLLTYEIHPGDELMCLGFPLSISSESGFPILRSGKIASYPIVPTNVHKSILFDFRVFGGNSGGPVYFVDRGRTYGGLTHLGETIQFVIGLVTSQWSVNIDNQQKELQIAAVVPATFIRETINLLPANPAH